MSEAELTALRESLAAETAARAKAEQERDASRLAAAIVGAGTLAAETLAKIDLPDVARKAIAERVNANPPLTADGALDRDALVKALTEAATTEKAYIDAITGRGEVRGMGSGSPATEAVKDDAALADAFARMGLSESAAKTAAAGRSVKH